MHELGGGRAGRLRQRQRHRPRFYAAALLPGATITITSVERNTVDTVVANELGVYLKERLLPGVYEIRAELAGFKAAVVPRVQISVDTQTPVDFALTIGQLSESVTVSGGSPLLKTDRADVATRFRPGRSPISRFSIETSRSSSC